MSWGLRSGSRVRRRGTAPRSAGGGRGGPGPAMRGGVAETPEKGRATVMLRFGEKPDQSTAGRVASAGPDGKFTVTGLEPGYYRVSAPYSSGNTQLQSQAVDVRLAGGGEKV